MNNSLCTLPVVLQPLRLFAGRVICTTASHSPDAAGNKGSLFAAVYAKDTERDAGGAGEKQRSEMPPSKVPPQGAEVPPSKEGLGLAATSQVYPLALFPSPPSLLPAY